MEVVDKPSATKKPPAEVVPIESVITNGGMFAVYVLTVNVDIFVLHQIIMQIHVNLDIE